MALRADDRHGDAEDELRQLIANEPSNGTAHTLLGKVLQEAGRFEEATVSFETAIARAPFEADAYQGLVSSKRLNEADRPLIERILSRLEAKEEPDIVSPVTRNRRRMLLHFAAGKGFDDLGDYAKAMTHFDAANTIRRRIRPFNQIEVEERVDQLVERFTPRFFADHLGLGHPDPTPILIVGMPRSGTTLLERIIASHPFVRARGELDFWSERGPRWANAEPDALARAAEQLRSDYLHLLRRGLPEGSLRATDKLPFNFFWVGLVHLLFPNARFIHSRRNPVDTCLSIYMTPVRAAWGFASDRIDLASYYRLYLRLMDHWRTVIPSNRLLELDYEVVVAKPEEAVKQLVEFSGLAWDPKCLRPERNDGVVMTASHWQVRQPIYQRSVDRWRRYDPWIGELRELL